MGRRKGMRGRWGGGRGEAPASPQVCVPDPQGVEKGLVMRPVKGGGKSECYSAPRGQPYNMAAHCCMPPRPQPQRSSKKPNGGARGGYIASPATIGQRGGKQHPYANTNTGRCRARHQVRTRGSRYWGCSRETRHRVPRRPILRHPSSLGVAIVPRTLRDTRAPLGCLGGHPCDNAGAAHERLLCFAAVCAYVR